MDVLVVTPFPVGSMMGNSVSARRIAGILGDLGLAAAVGDSFSGQDARALLALHARRSAPAVEGFGAVFPGRPICLLLPGSDLHRDLPDGDTTVVQTMALADALVVAQEGSLGAVPEEFRAKTTVVPKSVDLPVTPRAVPETPVSRATVLSHLREQKDPFCVEEALHLVPGHIVLQVDHYGAEASPGFADEACSRTASNARYTWHGGVDREEAVAALAAAELFINTSLMEGGSNAVAEAIALHLPIVATDIPGNTGMLGTGHPGLFPPGDPAALSRLLSRCASDLGFVRTLAQASAARAPRFTREAESAAWATVFRELGILC